MGANIREGYKCPMLEALLSAQGRPSDRVTNARCWNPPVCSGTLIAVSWQELHITRSRVRQGQRQCESKNDYTAQPAPTRGARNSQRGQACCKFFVLSVDMGLAAFAARAGVSKL